MNKLVRVIATVTFLGWAGSAAAGHIITTETCFNDTRFQCATGVNDLIVGTDTFDVSFVQSSYNSIFASVNPYFLDDYAGATSAGVAIASLFNRNSPTMLWTAGQAIYSLAIPYGYDPVSDTFSMNMSTSIDSGATYISQPIGGGFDTNYDTSVRSNEGFAVFELQSPSGVPTPATFGLFGVALASLGWTRRKKA